MINLAHASLVYSNPCIPIHRYQPHVRYLRSLEGTKVLLLPRLPTPLKMMAILLGLPRSMVLKALLLRRSQREAPCSSLKLKILPQLQKRKMWRQGSKTMHRHQIKLGILCSATDFLRRRLLMLASKLELGDQSPLHAKFQGVSNSILL